MNKLQRSWLLFKRSLAVMAMNKQLIVFPVITLLFTLVIAAFFLAPAVLLPMLHSGPGHADKFGHLFFVDSTSRTGHPTQTLSPLAIAYLAVMYLVSMFCATFFNVAFYHEILEALCGRPVAIGRGLKFALTKWKAILMWTLFAGLVGLIIKQIEERLGIIGSIVGRFIGIAWSVAAVFVIPLIVYEQETNPITLLKNSAGVLRRTWGESLIGYIGLSFATNIIFLISLILPISAFVFSSMMQNYWLFGIVGGLWLVAIVALMYLTSIAGQIYKGALYLYAAYNFIPASYDQDLLASAWKFKKAK